MMTELTIYSLPPEYGESPVYDRVPTPAAEERMEQGLTTAAATKDDLPASVRATLSGS